MPMPGRISDWSWRTARQVFQRLGYDLRRLPRGRREERKLAACLEADVVLLPRREQLHLAENLTQEDQTQRAAEVEASIHLNHEWSGPCKLEMLRNGQMPVIL